MHTLLHLAALAVTVLVLSRFLPGFNIRRVSTAAVVAVVFSVVNFLLGWAITAAVKAVLFVPALFTLGILFVFVPFIVNLVLLWLTDKLLASFRVDSLRALVVAAGAITVVNWFFASSYGVRFCAHCSHF
jgi:putative membrane protein